MQLFLFLSGSSSLSQNLGKKNNTKYFNKKHQKHGSKWEQGREGSKKKSSLWSFFQVGPRGGPAVRAPSPLEPPGGSRQSSKLSRYFGLVVSEDHGAAGYPPDANPMQRTNTARQFADLRGPLEQVVSPCTQHVFLALLSPAAVCIQPLAYFLYQLAGLPGAQHLQVDRGPALAVYKLKNYIGLTFALLRCFWLVNYL